MERMVGFSEDAGFIIPRDLVSREAWFALCYRALGIVAALPYPLTAPKLTSDQVALECPQLIAVMDENKS